MCVSMNVQRTSFKFISIGWKIKVDKSLCKKSHVSAKNINLEGVQYDLLRSNRLYFDLRSIKIKLHDPIFYVKSLTFKDTRQ